MPFAFTRSTISAPLASALLLLTSVFALAANEPPDNLEHPGEVALSQETDGSWIFKSFPGSLPLYIFEGDEPGDSSCDNRACTAVWPPVKADENDDTVGNWTVVLRDDGERQWAYKGYPVHTFFADIANTPRGEGLREGWYDDAISMYEFFVKMTDDPQMEIPEGLYYEEAEDDGGNDKPVWRLLEP